VAGDPVHIDHAGMAAGAEAGDGLALQVHAHADRGEARRVAALQAQLVEAGSGAHQDREGLGRDLDEGRAPVAVGDVIKGGLVVREQAHEDVDPARGALGIGAGRDALRQGQALLKFGDVDAAPLQHGAGRKVDLMHHHVRQPVGHGPAGTRQEGGAHPPGADAQAQVQAGRLDLVRIEGPVGGDGLAGDQGFKGLAGQNPCAGRLGHGGTLAAQPGNGKANRRAA